MARSKIILIVAVSLPIIVLAFFGVKAGGEYYYMKNNPPLSLNADYQHKIDAEKDAYKASRLGMVFLKTDNLELAELAFEKSTNLDANWRDGWIWKGYTELEQGEPQKALDSLKTAEKIDPVYPFTYQLLAKTYELLGNTSAANAANQKMGYLTKQ